MKFNSGIYQEVNFTGDSVASLSHAFNSSRLWEMLQTHFILIFWGVRAWEDFSGNFLFLIKKTEAQLKIMPDYEGIKPKLIKP